MSTYVNEGDRITARELDVLYEIVAGGGYREVGSRLGISNQTVKNHVSNVHRKLGVGTTLEAMVRVGILSVNKRLPIDTIG